MTDDGLVESLRAAERRLQAAQLASDVDVLDELIDDELLFTGPDGSQHTKADDLAAHRGGQQQLERVEEVDLRVRLAGSTGVTWFLGDLTGTLGGAPFAARLRYTRTWAHGDAGWRLVAAHATIVPSDG
ncbi:nuclear transport factor 2 family protein [Pseudonocardia sp. CA-107938]|uniref:nuclear transport factor 2 family protein n=1 Tax=Pseudonocardia sp. CA-107938 TaxID=3240021 RepID=UPI003D9399A4